MAHVQGRRVESIDELAGPGSFLFTTRTGSEEPSGLWFVCPCGCGAQGHLSFVDKEPYPRWSWDGNRDAPTLSPSVQRTEGCRWHGFLRGGVWEAC